ncbi:MAG: lipopolysaccharide biosynthesis protein [Ferruginibacter sp.]
MYDTISVKFNLKKNFIPVFVGRLLPILVLVVISILYSRKLSYDDYGKFQTFWIYSNVLNIIVAFAMPSIILANRDVVFHFFMSAYKKKIGVFYVALYIAVAVVFYLSVHNLFPAIKFCILVFIALQFASTVADTFLIKRNQLNLYFVANFIYSILFLAIHLYFYFNVFDLQLLVYSLLGLVAAKSLLLFFIKKPAVDAHDSTVANIFFKNWLYLGANEMVGVIARWLDKMYVVFLLSAANFAIFVNGTIEIPLFAVLISAAETFMLTKISHNVTDKKQSALIFKESFKLLSFISFPVFFMLLLVHEEAFSIVFNNRYNQSVPIFLISIFIIPVRINHYSVILQCYHASNKILAGAVIDILLALVLMTFLYPAFGVAGVALAIVLSTYVQVFYYLWHSAKLIKVGMSDLVPFAFLAKLFLGLALLYLCFFFLKYCFSPLAFVVIVFALTTIVIALAFIYYFYYSKNKLIKHQKNGIE